MNKREFFAIISSCGVFASIVGTDGKILATFQDLVASLPI